MTTTADQLIHKLRNVSTHHLEALKRGLLKAGLELQRESQKIVPVEHGDLNASAFTKITHEDNLKPQLAVGYADPKAVFVHEIKENAHGKEYNAKHAEAISAGRDFSRGENQVYKFLEKPARQNSRRLQAIVAAEVTHATKKS